MGIDVFAWTEEALLDHGHFVRRLARTLVVDENEADELAQETWLVALRQASGEIEQPRSWLAGVLRSVAFTRQRAERRRTSRAAGAEQREDARSADREAEELESQQRVVAAVLELDPPLRGVILLRYYRGLPLAEIALRSGTPLETVRTRLKRAHHLLRGKLDRDFGDRASWCLALAALSELPRPSAVSLGAPPLMKIGGVIMSWKYVAAVVVALVAALGIFWGLREEEALSGPPSEPPVTEAMAELPAEQEPMPAETAIVAEVPESPERQEVAAVPPPEEPVDSPAPGVWLVGQLISDGVQAKTPVRLVVDSSRRHPWELDEEIEEKHLELVVDPPYEAELPLNSPFEVDLTELFERGEVTDEIEQVGDKKFEAIYDPELPIEGLSLSVRNEQFLPLERRLELDPRLFGRFLDGERVELEVELRLEPVGTTIEGTVVLPEGVRRRPIHVALHGFGFPAPLEEYPLPMPRQQVTCDREGRFLLTVSEAERAVLVAGTDGHREPVLRPESRILEIELGERLQIPPIELTEGERIAGQLLEVEGASERYGVQASIVGGDRFTYRLGSSSGRITDLKWIDGAFELAKVAAKTRSGDSFLLQGLGPWEYQLTSSEFGGRSARDEGEIPVARFEGVGILDQPAGGVKVRAPAIGVSLDPRPDYAGIQILGDGAPLGDATGRLAWEPRAGGMGLGGRIETDELGRARFALGKGMEIDCWVVFSAPGWKSSALVHVNELPLGEESFEPIELAPGLPPVTLRLLVNRHDGGAVERARVTLLPWAEDTPRPDQRESGREAGLRGFSDYLTAESDEFRVAGLQPGRYWCELSPSLTRGSAPPWRTSRFELLVPAQDEYAYNHELGPGGHVRVVGVAGTGLEKYHLRVRTPEGWHVSCRFGDSTGGTFQTTDPLDPGDYVLRIDGLPGGVVELPFTAVDGEVVELKPELQPR